MERIDLRALKHFARSKLSGYPILRNLILSEADDAPADKFVGMVHVWLRVFDFETRINTGEMQVFPAHTSSDGSEPVRSRAMVEKELGEASV